MANPNYPATTLAMGSALTIENGNVLHNIINGSDTQEFLVDEGYIPSVRKALKDNFYYTSPIDWLNGGNITDYKQLVKFTDGTMWEAPTARATNPILMGVTPIGDSLWKYSSVGNASNDLVFIARGLNVPVENVMYGRVGASVAANITHIYVEEQQKTYGKPSTVGDGEVIVGIVGGVLETSAGTRVLTTANNSDLKMTLASAIASTSIVIGDSIRITDRADSVFDVVLSSSVNSANFDVELCVGSPDLALYMRNSSRTITASMMGFATETLFSDTQIYKTISYPVMRYTQNYDTLDFFNWFIAQDRFDTFDFEDRKLYLSYTVVGDWSGKHLTGSCSKNCGFVHGQINWADGTKCTSITNIGLFGKIGYMSLPLPVTIDPLLQFTAGWFWRDDSIDFGFGFGALGALTASSDGNTNDIVIDSCYFEMRDAVISGGSAPNDEDRPKVTGVVFRNCETKGIMNHGFASIHFRGSKVHDNHFYEHYSGYCCDFSLGSQDSEFYNNTGDRLAAGVKSEPRSFNASFRNKFYDNRLTIRWRWENTGAAYNTLFRTKGAEVELYNNTITTFDYNGDLANIALNIEGLSTDIHDNKFYLKGTPTNLLWFAQIFNGIDVPTAGQRLSFVRNKLFNQTSVSLRSGLQIGSTNSDTFSEIEHCNNEYYGLWDEMVNAEFGAGTPVIDRLVIDHNTFPNTTIFKARSLFVINDISLHGNNTVALTNNITIDLGNITCAGNVKITGNECDYSRTTGSGFVSKSNSVGDISAAKLIIKCNTLTDLDNALCYMLGGGGVDVPVDTVDISGNSIIWSGASVWTPSVYARGATTFVMHGNTLINHRATTCVIHRPAIAGGNSIFDFNPQVGSFTDSPTP